MVRGTQVPLDLSRFTSVEEGLRLVEDARRHLMAAAQLARPRGNGPILLRHLELGTLVAAAAAYHEGAVREAIAGNAHSTYALIRAQVEVFAVANYAVHEPDYLELLMPSPARRTAGAPRRRSMQSLIDRAVRDGHGGIGHVYAWLSDVAHFGQGAMSLPLGGGEESADAIHVTIDIAPHWRDQQHELHALASIEEHTLGIAAKVALYHEMHIAPLVADPDLATSYNQVIGRAAADD